MCGGWGGGSRSTLAMKSIESETGSLQADNEMPSMQASVEEMWGVGGGAGGVCLDFSIGG